MWGGIVAGNDQHRHCNLAHALPDVKIANRCAAGGITFDWCIDDHAFDDVDGIRLPVNEIGGEPALRNSIRNGRHAVVANHCNAIVPQLRRRNLCCAVGDDETAYARRRIHAQPQADHAAHGQSAKIYLRQFERVHDGNGVISQIRDPVRPGCRH